MMNNLSLEGKKYLIHLGILCIISLILKNILMLVFNKIYFFNTTYLNLISNGIITILAVLMPFVIGKHFFGLLANKKVNTSRLKIKLNTSVLMTIFSFGACIFLNFVTVFISMMFSWQDLKDKTSTYGNDYITITLMLLVLAIIPAICEEMVFRGIVIDAFLKYGNKFAICISALSFGILHTSLSSVVFAFGSGVIFAFLRIMTNSVIPSMIVHFLNNALGVLTSVLFSVMSQQDYNTMYCIIIVLSAILTFLGIVFVYVNKKNFETWNTQE